VEKNEEIQQLKQQLADLTAIIEKLQRRKFEDVATDLPLGMAMVDLQGKITYMNSLGCDILETNREKIVGTLYYDPQWLAVDAFGEIIPKEELPAGVVLLGTKPGQKVVKEHAIVLENSYKWLSVTAAPAYDFKDQLIGSHVYFQDITQYRTISERLLHANHLFDMGTWEYFQEKDMLVFGKGALSLLQIPNQGPIRFSLFIEKYCHPDDRELLEQMITGLVHHDTIVREDIRIRTAENHYDWFTFSGQKQTIAHKMTRIFGGILNISETKLREEEKGFMLKESQQLNEEYLASEEELKHALQTISGVNEKLRASEGLYKTMVENIPDTAVYLYDHEMRIIRAEGTEISKYIDKFSLLNRKFSEVFPAEPYEMVSPYMERALQGVEEKFYTSYLNVPYQHHCLPLYQENGSVYAALMISFNIAARVKMEQGIKDLAERLALATQAASIGIWDQDLTTLETFWDDNMYKLYGYYPNQQKEPVYLFKKGIHPLDAPIEYQAYLHAIRHKELYRHTFRIILPDGRIRYIEAMGKVTYDAEGKPVRMTGVNWDITREKHYEENLLQKNRSLEKLNKELDRFVYSVSHDLRAPLTSILGLINISQAEADPVIKEEYLRLMAISAMKLDNFIQEITHFSRNARAEVQSVAINPWSITQEIIDQHQFMDNARLIEKRVGIDPEFVFYSDPSRLKVVLNNLISNSIKYARLHTDQPYLSVAVYPKDEHVVIEIEDNGIGIKPEHQPKVFEMFYRAVDDKNGSGLGLYIVKETIDKLSGHISMHSVYGEGTKFTITLPNLM
jgi:signal transduction histidine kinase/transcriptional regulator with PAS, ATPase and Fis domain